MTARRPRHLVHRGSVLASGLLVDARLIGEQRAHADILHLRLSGLEVFRHDERVVVRFREPVRGMADAWPGAPLVRHGKLLSALPLDDDEVGAIDARVESVVVARGGVVSASSLDVLTVEDPSTWLDLASFDVDVGAVSLGAVAPPPVARIVPVGSDVRAPLKVGAMAPEAQALARALETQEARPVANAASRRGRLSNVLSRVLGVFRAGLAALFAGGPATAAPPSGPPQRGLAVMPAPPPDPSFFAKAAARFRHALARALSWAGAARFVGRAHAKYLSRMLEMFEEGDLDSALRHAIPLSSGIGKALSSPAIAPPSPRADLSIAPHRGTVGTSLGLGEDLFSVLRRTYRRAFERLVAAGEIEKAAFVLVELLQSTGEAVSFLERHGRFLLAAQIAEARGLDPALVVRQWFLAGQHERAIQIARRTGSFADAVHRLEETHKDQALALRMLWANSLAEAGAYAAAVDVVWKVKEAEPLAREWIDRAIAIGGETGARMLVRKLRLLPDAFGEIRAAVQSVLADESEDRRLLTLTLGYELLDGMTNAGVKRIGSLVTRALLAEEGDDDAAHTGRKLLDAVGDSVLRADVLACRPKEPVVDRITPVSPPVGITAHAVTNVGSVRELNEDHVLATSLSGDFAAPNRRAIEGEVDRHGALVGVFDGCGGASSGERASELARASIFAATQHAFAVHGADVEGWTGVLASAMRDAGQTIVDDSKADAAHRGQGCTATVATIAGRTLIVAQVGDTRAYLLRNGKLVQVTTDHSLLNAARAEGKALTPDEELGYANIVTRALGTTEGVSADLTRVTLRSGDVVLLCSDGLWRVLSDETMRDALIERTPHHACQALEAAALAAGATDNFSIVVAQVKWPGPTFASVEDAVEVVSVDGATPPPAEASDVLRQRRKPVHIHRTAADVGGERVWDAVLLPDGRMLIALGELGVRLLARDGRVLTRFAQPTHTIVLSDHGDRAILVAERGGVVRLARLDLVAKQVHPWCDAKVSVFARTFDGSRWYVGHESTLFAIAATPPGWEHELELGHGEVRAIERDRQRVAVRFGYGAEDEVWLLKSDSGTLRRRRVLTVEPLLLEASHLRGRETALSAEGVVLERWRKDLESGELAPGFSLFDEPRFRDLRFVGLSAGRSVITDDWVVIPCMASAGAEVHVFDVAQLGERIVLALDGADLASAPGARPRRVVTARIQESRLVVADDYGRVLVVSLEDGCVLRDLRIT